MNYQYHTVEIPIELRNAILAQPKTLTQCFMMSLGYMRVTGQPLRIQCVDPSVKYRQYYSYAVIPTMLPTQSITTAMQMWLLEDDVCCEVLRVRNTKLCFKFVEILPIDCVLSEYNYMINNDSVIPTLPTEELRTAFVEMLDTIPKTLDACVMYALGVELASGDSMLVRHKSFDKFESYVPYVNVQGAVPSLSLRRVRLTTNGEEDNLADVTLDNVCGLFDDLWHVKPVEPFNPSK